MLPFYFRPLDYMRYSNMTWMFESIDLHPFICNLVVVVVVLILPIHHLPRSNHSHWPRDLRR
jgi:hypothetical protein